ncbi:MAG TPA: lipopolysaccharide transport periplasmic protein LptA [Persephonella sp.]|nr:lipopolysaccharide transport periplasmic protein LptA [Persephonella sp.]
MRRIILLMIILFTFSFAIENKNAKKSPVLIEADELKYDNENAVAVYKGNVIVKQEDFTLWADKIYIYFSKNKNSNNQSSNLEKIKAIGNVRFKRGVYFGRSEKAEYYEKGKFLKLIGNARLEKEGNIIEGDVITYYIDTEEAFVSGKNRVRTIIINESNKK